MSLDVGAPPRGYGRPHIGYEGERPLCGRLILGARTRWSSLRTPLALGDSKFRPNLSAGASGSPARQGLGSRQQEIPAEPGARRPAFSSLSAAL